MIPRRALLGLALLRLLAACSGGDVSTAARVTDAGGGAGQSAGGGSAGSAGGVGTAGAAGLLETPEVTCGEYPAFRGVFYNQEANCLETERPSVGIACTDFDVIDAGFFCVRRLSDGARFIGLSQLRKPVIDPRYWELCDAPGLPNYPPKPCFAVACARAPSSTCTEQQTREKFACGNGTIEWDKNCCRRVLCTDNGGCEAGQTCRKTFTLAGWECTTLPSGLCDCGGTLGGPEEMMCVNDDELPPLPAPSTTVRSRCACRSMRKRDHGRDGPRSRLGRPPHRSELAERPHSERSGTGMSARSASPPTASWERDFPSTS